MGPAAAFPFHLKRAVELMKSKVVKAHYGLVRKTPETTISNVGGFPYKFGEFIIEIIKEN